MDATHDTHDTQETQDMQDTHAVRLPCGLCVRAYHLAANAAAVRKVRHFLQSPAPNQWAASVDGRPALKVPAWFRSTAAAAAEPTTPLIRIHLGQMAQTGPPAHRDYALDVADGAPVAREVLGARRHLGPAIVWPRALDDPGRSIFCCQAALPDDLRCDVRRRHGCRYEVTLSSVVTGGGVPFWVAVERVVPV